jgi:hypothetical protein
MAIFNSYVKLPEGNGIEEWLFSKKLGIELNSDEFRKEMGDFDND